MTEFLVALILAAGCAAATYAQVGKRIGYSNGRDIWTLVGIVFGLVFVIVLVFLLSFDLLG